MADRDITQRVRIPVEGERELRSAAAEARKLNSSLETIAGGARRATSALQAIAQGAASIGRVAGPGSLDRALDEARDSARGVAGALADARKQADSLGKSDIDIKAKIGTDGRSSGVTDAIESLIGGRGLGNALEGVVGSGMQGLVGQLGSKFAGLAGPIGIAILAVQALQKAGEIAVAVLKIAIDLGIKGALTAIEASTARSSRITSLTVLTGTREEAERLFEIATKLGRALGQAPTETLSALNTLLSRGFKAEGAGGALEVIKAMSDLKIISPKANIENVITAIAQIKSKGKLSLEELQGQLGEQFDVSAVIKQLSTKLGKNADEIRKMISAGQINAETGIGAVLDAIRATTGQELGKLSEKAAETVPKLLEGIRDTFTGEAGLFSKVDIGPLKSFLKNVLDILSGPTGTALQNAITKTFGNLFEAVFGKLDGPEGMARLERTLQGFATFISGVGDIIAFVTPVIRFLVDVIVGFVEVLTGATDRVQGFGSGIESITASVTGLTGAIQGALSPLSGMGETIGASLVGGLVQGILSGIPNAIGATLNLTSAVTNAATGIRGFNQGSPSRVFAEMSKQNIAGLAQGAANDGPARTAMEQVAQNTSAATQTAIATPATPAGGGGGGGAPIVNVYMTPAPGATPAETKAHADAAVSGARESIQRFFRRRAEAA